MRCKGDHLKDENGSAALKALSLARDGEVLAWGSSGHNVNSSHKASLTGPLLCCRDVVVLGNVGPVLGQHLPGALVDLDLANAGHPGPVEAEVKAADAGEAGEVSEAHDTPPRILADWLDTVSTV